MRHYEEFKTGDQYTAPARTITETDVVAFSALSGDTNPLHTDAIFALNSRFQERIAHGLLGLACAGGFLSKTGIIDGTAVALLEVSWRFHAPVRIGDTIRASISVGGRRETSDPTQGIVEFDFQLLNQHDEVVQLGRQVFLILRERAVPETAASAS